LWVPSVSGDTPDTIYGYPVQWSVGGVFDLTPSTGVVAFCGDWDCLRIGIRRDVTVDMSTEAVLADATGKVLVSAFQDDKVIMRCHMRLGCVIGQPFTTRLNAAAKPFSMIPPGLVPGAFAESQDDENREGGHSVPADPDYDPTAPTPPVYEPKDTPHRGGRKPNGGASE
jgi:hypothetical protein